MSTTESKVIGIRAAVAAGVSSLGGRTREAVVEHFAQAQAAKQADALIKGLERLTTLEREGYKIKPTFAGYDADGKPVGDPVFTKEQVEERKKNTEQIEKLTNAINKADEKDDFGDLFNLVK